MKDKANIPEEETDTVVTPAGPRPNNRVHSVGPSEAVRRGENGVHSVVPKEQPITGENASRKTDELVLTPGGFRPKSVVHLIEPGHVLRVADGYLYKFHLSGKVVAKYGPMILHPGIQPLMPRNVVRMPREMLAAQALALGSGWITYADWANNTGRPTSLFSAVWVVPCEPRTHSGQTIFLFNGIQNSTMIYQPVLQWGPSGAGGGNYWAVASWYADGQRGQAFHSQLVKVKTGDVLVGIMRLIGQVGDLFNYNCEFLGIAGASLAIQNVQELTWCIETSEAYGITKCSDYPDTDSTVFSPISIFTGNLATTPRWAAVDTVSECGQYTEVMSANEVAIHYRASLYYGKQIIASRNADGRLEVFYVGIDDALYHNWQVVPNGNWNGEVAMGDAAKQIAVGQNADGRLEVFYVGTDDELYHNWQVLPNGIWRRQVALGGAAKQIAVGRNADGRLEVFYVGTDDALYHNGQVVPNGNWTGEVALGGAAKQIAVGQNADGRLEVFYVGTDDALYHNWQVVPNGNWNGEVALGGAAKQIAVGQNADGRLEDFYIGTDDALYHNWQVVPNGNWTGEVALGGAAKQIAVGRNADGRLEVFYVGTDDALYRNWQVIPNGNWTGEVALGGSAKQIAVGQNADGRLEVFYVGTDDALYHNCQVVPNGNWNGEVALAR